MIRLNATQYHILELLSDGLCHSGTALGQKLKISRSAIWKQVKHLIEFNLPIITIPNQGYQLKQPLILLNEHQINRELAKSPWNTPTQLHLLHSVDSTNKFLKELPVNDQLDVCCAEVQTQGRGRFGRSWYSPFGDNIYCSSRWNLQADLNKLSGLSLIVSLAVIATLKENNISQIQIKWPNDILWNHKKLCGSLIEIIAESNAIAQVIIGIGLNVNTDTQNNRLVDKPWCSLYDISQQLYNRNQLIAHLLLNLNRYLSQFLAQDLTGFMNEWQQYDYLKDKEITVHQAHTSLRGIARGINSLGQLILEDYSGEVHHLSSGDTSLKTI